MKRIWRQLAKTLNMTVEETPFINRSDSIPGIGNIQSIKDAVFPLKPGETTTGASRGVFYLIQMVEREAGGPAQCGTIEKNLYASQKRKGPGGFSGMDGITSRKTPTS